ncbi:MAG: heavy-metal-associated domain-containing protein [Bacteroidales bacterium]
MIFFAFSFLASLFGGITASKSYSYGLQLNMNMEGFFSSMITFWPFIVALVLLLLVILWYQNIKNIRRRRKQGYSRPRQGNQSIVFLGVVTVLVLILLAAPYYLEGLNEQEHTEQMAPEQRTELLLTVHGMTCGGCETLIQKKVGELEGVESVSASHQSEEVFIVYNKDKLNEPDIANTIENAGYTVVYQ